QVVAALEAADAGTAVQAIDAYDALARRLHLALAMERALQLRAMPEMMAGRLAVAENLIGQSLALTDRMYSPGAMRAVTIQLRYLYLYQGRASEVVESYLGQGSELSAGMKEFLLTAIALPGLQRRNQAILAYVCVRAGRMEEA